MKAGDRVKLIGLPQGLRDDDDLQTLTLFKKCLGQSFTVAEVETVEGLPYQLAKLDVGHVLGEETYKHSIWVEPQFLKVENESA